MSQNSIYVMLLALALTWTGSSLFAQTGIGTSPPTIAGGDITFTPHTPIQPDDEVFSFHRNTMDDSMSVAIPKLVFSIKANGDVVLGEDVTMSDAAKAFWEQVGTGAPCAVKALPYDVPSPRDCDCDALGDVCSCP